MREDTGSPEPRYEAVNRLVTAAQQGDHEAFGQLVRQYQDMAYAYGYAILGDPGLSQDVAQEAFLEAFEGLPRLRSPAAFTTWFRRILHKRCDRYRRKRQVPTVPLHHLMDVLEETTADPGTTVYHREVYEEVDEALAVLSEPQRLATTLFYLDGYSQREISDFLEIPVTTLKKQLFTARKKMKERLFVMTESKIQQHKPSEDRSFTDEVQFFTALSKKDAEGLRKILAQNPDLIHLNTRWNATAMSGHYWPIKVSVIHLAAGLGDEAMVDALLDAGADVNGHGRDGKTHLTPKGETPLHETAKLQNTAMARLLITRGADINAINEGGQTPLFYAVYRNDHAMVDLLIQHGADVNIQDEEDRTASDWASMKGLDHILDKLTDHGAERPEKKSSEEKKKSSPSEPRRVPVGDMLKGRVLDGTGLPQDQGDALPDAPTSPVYPWPLATSPILQTGVKVIDLMAPIPRGGDVGLFTPMSGVGIIFMKIQIIKSIADLYNGRIVYLNLEDGSFTVESMILEWRAHMGLSNGILQDKMVILTGNVEDATTQRQTLIETGLAVANAYQRDGHEVLLVVSHQLAETEGISDYLKTHTAFAPEAAVTTLYEGGWYSGGIVCEGGAWGD